MNSILTPKIFFPPSKSFIVRKIIIDFICLIGLLIPLLVLYCVGQPFQRGFNCGDESIRYPYEENTITSGVLYMYSTFIPFTFICLNEYYLMKEHLSNNESRGSSTTQRHFKRAYMWQTYIFIIPFAFAAVTSQMITDIAKYTIGRLRPHFIDLCRPVVAGKILYRDSRCYNPHEYITEYTCSNEMATKKLLRDVRLSFMSGHSSYSAVCLVYLVLYIQMRVKFASIGLLKPLFQALLVCLIVYTGLSRISDYKHHWSDVLTGLIQGTFVAILVVFFVSDIHKSHTNFRQDLNNDNPNTNHESGV